LYPESNQREFGKNEMNILSHIGSLLPPRLNIPLPDEWAPTVSLTDIRYYTPMKEHNNGAELYGFSHAHADRLGPASDVIPTSWVTTGGLISRTSKSNFI